MDAASLPKGRILGWVAPSSETQQKVKGASGPPPNKNAKKRANQRARKAAEKSEAVKDSWEDEEEEEGTGGEGARGVCKGDGTHTTDKPDWAVGSEPTQDEAEVMDKLSKLKV